MAVVDRIADWLYDHAQESAAKTALMLNGGTLDSSTITVTSEDTAAPSLANVKSVTSSAQTPAEKDESEISQEDKPRTAIAAEYLAAGYHLGDTAIERAIAADKGQYRPLPVSKKGISC